MDKNEFEMILYDRIEIIKTVNAKYDIEKNGYISFSGGKDSTILHYLFDMALPNNNIPRVYIDTGIEYQDIRKFVIDLANIDKRIIIVKPIKPIKQILEKYGYPFKSKQHSHDLAVYQNSGMTTTVKKYLRIEAGNKVIACPKSLLYQFTPEFKIKVSELCCNKMKKEPVHKWEKENNKTIALTGMRKEEGGQRASIKGCILTHNGKTKFHPLLVVNDEWEDEFVKKFNIPLCKLYYRPYNFKRTGCAGCPFSLELQKQLDIMEELLPNQKKQCEYIWNPIYKEYRRIHYRLRGENDLTQMNIFDFEEGELK